MRRLGSQLSCLRLAVNACLWTYSAAQLSSVIQADGQVKAMSSSAKGKHLVRSGKHPRPELIEDDTWVNSSLDETSSMKLAVYVKKADVMKYDWPGWNNCDEHDAGGDKKTKFYCAPAKAVKITFVGASRGVFTLNPDGQKSVKDLFNGAAKVHGDIEQWRSISRCYQFHCNQMGFQAHAQHHKCRFGFVTNNENDCLSPDHSAGVGCPAATGSRAYCCSNTGCHHFDFDTKIEVTPLLCEEDVCPKDKKVLKKELPEFCEGSKCTVDECCDDKPEEKSSSQMRGSLLFALVPGLFHIL